MANPSSIPYENFIEETKMAVEACYPVSEGKPFISATTLIYELNENPEKYPGFSKLKSDRHRKIVLTHNCVDTLKWDLWGKNRGQYHNGAVYRRRL